MFEMEIRKKIVLKIVISSLILYFHNRIVRSIDIEMIASHRKVEISEIGESLQLSIFHDTFENGST